MKKWIGSYILDEDNNPVPVDTLEWAKWLEQNRTRKIVKQTTLPNGKWVSTVFLGLDHNYSENGPPLLFETTIFVFASDGKLDEEYMERYSTWEAAEQGHEKCCLMTEPYYDSEDN